MNKFIIIYCSIIILFLFLFYSYNIIQTNKYNKNNIDNINNNMKETFNPNKNTPSFVKNYLNKKVSSAPNYRVENINQYDFDRLYKKLQLINNEKIKLKGALNYELRTQSTTDDKLRIDLDHITKYVLLILNEDQYYNFSKTNFGNVEIWTDLKNNSLYKYELFLWDKKNYFEIKLVINIVKFSKQNNSYKFGIKDRTYIFPDYNIGIPSKDQLIPLPTEVNDISNSVDGTSTISPNNPMEIKYLYLNQIEIQNSTLIVNYNKNNDKEPKIELNENGFCGITDMSLEYIGIEGDNNPYLEKSVAYNKWPTLDEEPKWKAQYPAKPPPQVWDVDGIYYYSEKGKKKGKKEIRKYCSAYEPGTIWSPDKMPLQPYFWPTLATIPRNCSENNWLFDQVGPNGTFFGGGKK